MQDLHADSLGETGGFIDRDLVDESPSGEASKHNSRLKMKSDTSPNAMFYGIGSRQCKVYQVRRGGS